MDALLPDHWHRIDRIFAEALDCPDAERTAFVKQVCGDDLDLYAEVITLLNSRDDALGILGESATGFAAPLLPGLHDHLVQMARLDAGARIGPYRVLEEIGRGGMGAVYLAERNDQYHRRVALKLVKRGLDSEEIRRRFRYERQILAELEHPHIARLYDGGMSDDGRPYLAMEYVDGLPIDHYCDARQLSVDKRLRLFVTACEAVQYAHQNLVVHRDLKPSNILVTDARQVKLLDFGIAKLLTKEASLAAPMTRTGVRMLTPEYASPEQVCGGAITTATDVYALGVILFELLTGRRPHTAATALEIERAILEMDPERPSTVVRKGTERRRAGGTSEVLAPEAISAARATSPERLQRQLEGDLDVIVLKALKKEPERRYASAAALAEDIDRYLAGLPVTARPDTLGYRIRKFVRRNKVAVTVAFLFITFLASYAVTITVHSRRIAAERDKSQEISAFLENLFEAPDPYSATATDRVDTLRVRDFLERGMEKVNTELGQQPSVQAQMLHVLGRVYQRLGLFEQARALLVRAVDLRRQFFGSAHYDVAESMHALASVLHSQGDYDAAENLYREALAIRMRLLDDKDPAIAHSLNDLARTLKDQGDLDAAETMRRQALALQRTLLGDDHPDIATSLLELGRIYHSRADPEAAEPLYREALAMRRRALGDEHPSVAEVLNTLGAALKEQGDYKAAEPLYREALAMHRRVLGDEHPEVTTSYWNLAGLLREKGDYTAALPLFSKVIEMDRKMLGDHHHYVGLDLYELGITYSQLQTYDRAISAFGEALEILRIALPEKHPEIASALVGLGGAYVDDGQQNIAEPLLRESLQIRLEKLGQKAWRTGVAQSSLGECLMLQGRYAEAEGLLLDGYHTLRDSNGPTRAAISRLVSFYEKTALPGKAASYRTLLAEATR